MNITCGTDIIEISRIKQSMEAHENSFKNSIFTENEVKYCESHKGQKYQHYAARFAAKEAIFKALSKKLNSEFIWTDFEVINLDSGKPEVVLKREVPEIESIDISLSHCKDYALATVIVLFKE